METNPAETLRHARSAARLTQEELASAVGVTQPTVSQWELGNTIPTGPARRLLSQVLGLPLDVIDSWFERREAA